MNPDKLRIGEDAMRVAREFPAGGKIIEEVREGRHQRRQAAE